MNSRSTAQESYSTMKVNFAYVLGTVYMVTATALLYSVLDAARKQSLPEAWTVLKRLHTVSPLSLTTSLVPCSELFLFTTVRARRFSS